MIAKHQVIVIGCGPAGIGASVTLARKGLSYITLQARNRIGGRVYSQSFEGVEIDLGAAWVHNFSKKKNIISKEMVKLGWGERDFNEGEEIQFMHESSGEYDKSICKKCEQLSQKYLKFAYKNSEKFDKDLSVLEAGKQFYEKSISILPGPQKDLVDFYLNQTELMEAASLDQLSTHDDDEQIEDDDTENDYLPKNSYYQLYNQIAKSEKINVQLGKVAVQVIYGDKGVKVICKDGSVYESDKVIIAVPLGILKKQYIRFTPELPKKYEKTIQKLGYGLMNKVVMSFHKPFWKKNVGQIYIASQKRGKFPQSYNFSEKGKYILVCLIAASFANEMAKKNDQQVVAEIVKFYESTYKTEVKLKSFKVTRWQDEEFSCGSYSFIQVGSTSKAAQKLRENIDEVLWMAGEHCYPEYMGAAHGAYQTGVWAAESIASLI